jgi:hypothetical protein
MSIAIGSPSFVAETTRTIGVGAYFPDRRIPRCARISEIYVPGDIFDYFVDDGGGLAEFGRGILNLDLSISRLSIHWSTLGGVGGFPINWGPGKRTIRIYSITINIGTSPSVPTIHGFWSGVVGSGEKIERYLFTQSATLLAGMPGSRAIADTPNSSGVGNLFVDELGNFYVDESGNSFVDGFAGALVGGNFFVDESGDSFVDELGNFFADGFFGIPGSFNLLKNGLIIGGMEFPVGSTNAIFSLVSNVSFVSGDLFEIVGPASAGDISDLVWSIPLS